MADLQRLTELLILSSALVACGPGCDCGTSHAPGDAGSDADDARDAGQDARVPRDADAGDAGGGEVDAWIPPDDAGLACDGDFVPAGIRLDPGAHVFDITFGDDAVWYWPWPSVAAGTQRLLRISRDLGAIDDSLPMEGLPLTIGGTSFYGFPTYVVNSSGTATVVRILPVAPDSRRVLLATYGRDGLLRAGPVDVGEIGRVSPSHVARDGDGYVVLGQTDAVSPTCSTTFRHVRADPVTMEVEEAPEVALEDVLVDAVAWRGDRWTAWAWMDCTSAPGSAVLFDILPDGTTLGPRPVDAWPSAVTAVAPRPREVGDWPILLREAGPSGETLHYARLDPDTGSFTTPPTAVGTATAIADGNILLAARDATEDALLFVELYEGGLGRTRFLRIRSGGAVLQDSVLADGLAPPPVFLLRWDGDRYVASFEGVVDALICSGSP